MPGTPAMVGGQINVDLSGRVALVTGSTRGLGRAIAEGLAANGADVVVVSRRPDAVERAAAEIAATSGRRVIGCPCHLGRWDDIDGLVERAYGELGRIDVLVNNAGMSPTYPDLGSVTEELFDKTLAVNLKGPFRLSVLVGQRMAAGDGGSIVNISSTGALRSQPGWVPYSAAKAGLNSMTAGLALAFGPTVRVNTIMPGLFETDVSAHWNRDRVDRRVAGFALGRVGQPDEIVGTVLYLASDASSYTTGSIIAVDGGEQ